MTSGEEPGFVRIEFQGADGKNTKVVYENHTDRTNYAAKGSNVDRRQLAPLPFKSGGSVADENSKVVVSFKSDAADTIESEESEMTMDVTIVNKRTGETTPSVLTFNNMSGSEFDATDDVVCTTGNYAIVSTHTVPAGTQLILGQNGIDSRFMCYMGDDA